MAISAIDTPRMKTLCNEVQDYTEKTQATLNQIYDSLENAKTFLKGDNSSDFFSKVTDLQISLKTVISNLGSYIDDYNNILTGYINSNTEIAREIKFNQVEEMKEDK